MLESVLFYTFSLGVIVSAFGVITARSAIYSVLLLVSAMCLMAGLFVLLKAYLVATILVLVYAGAILVLFLFVVMLVDFNKFNTDWKGLSFSPGIAILLGVLICAQTMNVIRAIPSAPSQALDGTTHAIGLTLFHQYVLPFELTSFLLLAAVVSVVVLAKKESR
jgi:NADH-quinone oxidoreductase subunit J